MGFYRHTNLRATFKKLSVDAGKATIAFEVGGDELYTLPTLALLVGEKCVLDISSDQAVLLLEEDTGEVFDGGAGRTRTEEEGAQADEDEADAGEGGPELPPAATAYDEELDDIFGPDAA